MASRTERLRICDECGKEVKEPTLLTGVVYGWMTAFITGYGGSSEGLKGVDLCSTSCLSNYVNARNF